MLFLVFCFCENNGILACGYLPEKTETVPPSFPRRRESRSVGTETYRVKRFLEILRFLDSHFSWDDGRAGFCCSR
ncbi:hypothetical protein F7O58_00785 [Neisseria meningitidis]|nr:hypothetical protein [Neisseria meningitidis]